MSTIARFLPPAGLLAAWLALPVAAATAEQPPSWHFFSGADLTEGSAFVHQGMIWTPRGNLHEPGWRLRGLVDGGAYRYRSDGIRITGRMVGLELMPGYSWFNDRAGLTLYLGGTISSHYTKPHEANKPRQGNRLGATVLAESWYRLTESVTLDASAGYGTASRSYTVRLAATVALEDRVIVEPEIAAFGEHGYHQQRGGVLVELHRTAHLRVLAGGGWSHDRDGSGAYLTVRLKSWR